MTDLDPDLGHKGNGPYRLLRHVLDGQVRRFLADLADPRGAQERRLLTLLAGSKSTQFALDHHLDGVGDFDAFREAVPIRTHAQLQPYLTQVAAGRPRVLVRDKVTMLLETSGTTGAPKHLPVTSAWARSVQQAQTLWTLGLLRDHEAVAHNKALAVVSPVRHATSSGGLPIGSNTGRMRRKQPWWLRLRYVLPEAVIDITDPVLRQYTALRFAMDASIASITTANPSMVLLLCRRLSEWREPLSKDRADGTLRAGPASALPDRLRRRLERKLRAGRVPDDWTPSRMWPLASVNCWTGGPAAYFAARLPEALGGPVSVREVGITASEGTFAFPLAADWPGSVLWTGGHLMEFVGDDNRPRWAWELEEGERVRMIITTEAGLWRYDLEDMVDVVGRCGATPVVRFVGKAGRYLNCVGERVNESQVSAAMADAALRARTAPVGFTVHIQMAEIPWYEVAVEGTADAAALIKEFDDALCRVNLEYASKRKSGRMGAPTTLAVPYGTYARIRTHLSASGASDGQIKDPIIALDAAEWGVVLTCSEVPR